MERCPAPALDWQQNGLVRAQSVAEATEAYFAEQDFIGQWLAEKCTVRRGDTTLWDRTADLYGSWSAYAKAAGEPPGPVKAFGPAMRRKGLMPYRTTQARGFSGVLLRRERPYGEHVG